MELNNYSKTIHSIHNFDEIEDQAPLYAIEDLEDLHLEDLDEVEVPVFSNREKYNMMLPVALSIASLTAYNGTNQFQAYLGMKKVESIIRSGSA